MEMRKIGISVIVLVVGCSLSEGASINWDNGGVGNDWFSATNWVGDVVPGSGDRPLINMSGADAPTMASGSTTVQNFYVGSNYGDTGLVHMVGGSLTAGASYIGRYGVGTVNQSGTSSAKFAGTLYMGTTGSGGRNGDGTWNLLGGTLDASRNDGNSIEIGRPVGQAFGALNISGGTLLTGEQLVIREQGILSIQGSAASITVGGSVGALTSEFRQLPGGILDVGVGGGGVSKILLNGANATKSAQFDSGALLDVGFIGGDQLGTWTVMELEGGAIADNGLQFATGVDTNVWSFNVDNSGANGILTVTAIPEPATLGLVAVFGGAVLFIRRRFMI